MKKFLMLFLFICCYNKISAQINYHSQDSIEKWNFHYQLTIIDQSHNSFKAPYSGTNSLSTEQEEALSLTTTLFIGHKLWKNAAIYFNPEISGGKGVSGTTGVAGFPNGETFRIGNATPTLYLARLFYRQYIPLGTDDELIQTDNNQLKEYVPKKRLVITAGKFSLSDFFDSNAYSHDPRTQLMNWALMSNGAWDYPANTRGYTDGLVVEYVNPSWALRAAGTLEPTYANGPTFDYNFVKTSGLTVEYTKNLKFSGHTGAIRLLGYRNVSKAPAYRDVINNYLTKGDTLDVNHGTRYGGVKYGFGINADQELSKSLGLFLRAGWNDGKTATWAFTEIDKTLSAGLNYKGIKYGRPDDNFGLAAAVNGLSADHKAYLAAGGYGFLIGDGKVTNYQTENVLEAYYSAKIDKNLLLSGDYQFVQNPAYNGDRGPVNFFSIRAHIEF